jgi:cytochrome c
MPSNSNSWWIAGILTAALVLLVAWGSTAGGRRADGIVTAAYGPKGDSYRFKAAVAAPDPALAGCVVCHSLEKNGAYRVAPGLYGIVDAPKARAGWYGYSDALRHAGGVWSQAELDKLLTSPGAFLPGTTKTLTGYKDPEERARIIAALAKLRG